MVLDQEQRHPVRQRELVERRELHRAQPVGLRRTRGKRLLGGERRCDQEQRGECTDRVHCGPPDAGAAPGRTTSSVRFAGARYVFATRFTSSLVTASSLARSVLISSIDEWNGR